MQYDPRKSLALSIIVRAVYDTFSDDYVCGFPSGCPNRKMIRSRVRREALEFINSKDLEFWIDLGGLNISASLIRNKLKDAKRANFQARGKEIQIDLENLSRLYQEDTPAPIEA